MTVHQRSTLHTIAMLITYEGSSGTRLLLQLIEEVGCDCDPNKDDQPDTSWAKPKKLTYGFSMSLSRDRLRERSLSYGIPAIYTAVPRAARNPPGMLC